MKATWFADPDVFFVDPRVFGNERLFFESFDKTTDDRMPEHERRIAWNDPSIALAWPPEGALVLSAKHARAGVFA